MKKLLISLLRSLIALGICWLLIDQGMMNLDKLPQYVSNKFFLLAILFSLLTLAASIFRFWYLVGKKKSISFIEIGKIVWSSTFLNTYVPSGISGDLYKGLMLKRHIPAIELTAYIIFDKAIGLYSLILISALFGFFSPVVERTFLLFSLLFSLGGFIIFFFSRRMAKLTANLSTKISTIFISIYSFRTQASNALGISIAAHLLGGISIYFLGVAVNSAQYPDIVTIYSVTPYALIVAAFPILPGGIGSGHLAFAYVFSQVGFSNGADIFTLYLLLQCSIALVGSLFLAKSVNVREN